MNRDDWRLFFTSGLEVLAWGEAAEQANAGLVAERDAERNENDQLRAALLEKDETHALMVADYERDIAEKDATIAAKDATILLNEQVMEQDRLARNALVTEVERLDAEIADLIEENVGFEMQHARDFNEIERLKAELALYKPAEPAFIMGDATRKQFLGAPFLTQFPGCYESEFYRSGDDRKGIWVDYDYVLNVTMPNWRARYPDAKYWWGDIEWFNASDSDGAREITAAEVAKVLPAFKAARDFAEQEGKGLLVGAYMLPKRFGTHMTDAEVRAQAEVYRPVLDVLTMCVLTLYAIYSDMDKSRDYIRRNVLMGRELMPGKKLFVIGAPYWHANVGAPLANTPLSAEWQRMFLEEVTSLADGYAPWLPAAYPKPTNEPWWLEARSFV
jgi:hypothetical protein